ncbi:MAG: GntR family transcriptional regulator [Armatimonadota bacterium]|nr:GntR family transcriptional regulator [Armatimonadota bacterium]MDR7448424.1 GntR family transcriptional regulator [Armatimonadota bacterium]MDR7480347.1 GntR family transcriptional regulator [Armatimonadota bacterium]MDR7488306.1 GntR family transcriptional regulator [Armatimonadota bacterium]MDR7491346.1 GntR family transcriptional regulator [Armatimonadota bacterium]
MRTTQREPLSLSAAWRSLGRLRSRQTLAELVAAEVRERIASGEFPMGGELNQFQLTRELGVSRTVVREAFRQLEAAGIIMLAPYRHAVVTPLDTDDLEDLWTLRTVLEGLAVRRAVRRPADAAARLGTLLAAMERETGEDWLELDRRFHQEIAELSGNPLLPKLLDAVRMPIDRFLQFVAGARPRIRSANREHRAILDALVKGDDARAVAVVRAHIDRTRRLVTDRLRRVGLASSDGTAARKGP